LARGQDKVGDTLHFYRRDPPGVSLGYFKKINEDVDIEHCREKGVVVVRRTSGGGSIFTDKDVLIYGLITGKHLGASVEDSFRIVCKAMISALEGLGIRPEFKPPNDILLNGKKISGNAQTIKNKVVLIHGTIILDMDMDLMRYVLKEKKTDNVSSILLETGKSIPLDELKEGFVNAIAKTLGDEPRYGELTEYENLLIEELIRNKYGKDEWNLKR